MENETKANDLLNEMIGNANLEGILQSLGLTKPQALQLLDATDARHQIRAARRLARIHSAVLLHRYGPTIMHRLIKLLDEDKPEIRLKSALALIELARETRSRRAPDLPNGAPPPYDPLHLDEEEAAEILTAVAGVLDQRRAAEAAGGLKSEPQP